MTRVGTKADVDPVLCTTYLACHVQPGSVRSKSMVDSGVCAKAWASWLIMSGEPPQAGNGAGKSRRRRQWKDCRPVARQVSTVGGDPRGPFLVPIDCPCTKKRGESGFRSRCLVVANDALYRLS